MSSGGIKRGDERRLKRDGRKGCVGRAKYTSYEFLEKKINKRVLTKYSYVPILQNTLKFPQKVT